ncbi:hypothetical protein RCOM_0651000 [Ricinus communis]|uniref:Homeobox-leucine zipper protein n=1 Tax=Ricinus communis TaxID=3988 RepID=B9SBB4_RICCO|nr:hypothetical protein RCOM_0651000 [Ricinus communis]
MDFFHTQTQQIHTPKHSNKKRLTQDQVAIWYQNKRARWKTQSLELEYNTLQVKLENALIDKKRLEKEVMQLREELRKAQEMVFAFNQRVIIPHHQQQQHHHHHPLPLPPHSLNINNVSCNSSCDEGGSTSLHEDVNGEVLQLDELYACLLGSSGGAAGSTWG